MTSSSMSQVLLLLLLLVPLLLLFAASCAEGCCRCRSLVLLVVLLLVPAAGCCSASQDEVGSLGPEVDGPGLLLLLLLLLQLLLPSEIVGPSATVAAAGGGGKGVWVAASTAATSSDSSRSSNTLDSCAVMRLVSDAGRGTAGAVVPALAFPPDGLLAEALTAAVLLLERALPLAAVLSTSTSASRPCVAANGKNGWYQLAQHQPHRPLLQGHIKQQQEAMPHLAYELVEGLCSRQDP